MNIRRLSRRRCLGQLVALAPVGVAASPAAPAPLRLLTAHLPPYAIEGDGPRRGALVELVERVFARAGWTEQRVQFYPWARAVHLASTSVREAVFPLSRTPDREADWQWLLPLQRRRFSFLTRNGSPRIERLSQAQSLRIGVVRGSASDSELLRRGLPTEHVVRSARIEDLLRMLELGMVDAIYGNPVMFREQLRLGGRDPSSLQDGLALERVQMWLAAHGGMLEDEIARIQAARRDMQQDGSAARILRSYGLGSDD